MRRNPLRLLACSSAIALGAAAISSGAFAQTNVGVTLTTPAAIVATTSEAMDFGTWALGHDGSNDITLTCDPSGTPDVTSATSGSSTANELTAAASPEGVIAITVAGAVPFNFYATITDFTDTGLTLQNPTYIYSTTTTTTAISTNSAAPTYETAPDANANNMSIGAEVLVSATPAAATAHTATIAMTYSY